MVDDEALKQWFCQEVLPLEGALMAFIRRNWRESGDVVDVRQDIYERVLNGARHGLPEHATAYVHAIARNHLINCAKRSRIVSFELVADLDDARHTIEVFHPERQLDTLIYRFWGQSSWAIGLDVRIGDDYGFDGVVFSGVIVQGRVPRRPAQVVAILCSQ